MEEKCEILSYIKNCVKTIYLQFYLHYFAESKTCVKNMFSWSVYICRCIYVCTLAYQGLFTVEVPTGPRLFADRCATLEEAYTKAKYACVLLLIYIAIVYNPFLLRKWRKFGFENLAKTDTLRQFALACCSTTHSPGACVLRLQFPWFTSITNDYTFNVLLSYRHRQYNFLRLCRLCVF